MTISQLSGSRFANVMSLAVLLTLVLVFVPRTSSIPGGYKAVDVNDDDVKKFANYAVDQLNAAINNYFYMKETKVLEAFFKIVAGKNYYLKIELSPTECTKTDTSVKNFELCQLQENSPEKPQICEVHVWVKPWMKEATMTDFKCNVVND